MSEKSSAELEREAEAVRAQMTETADSLQRKLSPGQLVDEMTSYFKNSDGRVALDNFKAQVRDNPLPLALVGAGLAWLFMGGGPSTDRIAAQRRSRFERTDFGRYQGDYPEGHWEDDVRDGERAGDSMRRMAGSSYSTGSGFAESGYGEGSSDSSMMDKVSSAYSSATDAASSAASAISDKASSAAGAVSDMASRSRQRMHDTRHYASDSMHNAGSRAQRMFSDTLDKEPLILGAIGLAVGAAIGAMMPRTRMEEEYLRPYAEKASDTVKDVAQQGMEQVRDVAAKVYDETVSGSEQSHDQGRKSDDQQGQQNQAQQGQNKLASTQPSSAGAGSAASKTSAAGTNATVTGSKSTGTSSGLGSGTGGSTASSGSSSTSDTSSSSTGTGATKRL
jgi:ElaB/YqjD/DUF883 family membrane-anchored ribosome-binding protein